MTFSKADIEKLFPYATKAEALKALRLRNRATIVKSMTEDTQEYTYNLPKKLTGLQFYTVKKQFNKLLGKY